MEHNVSADVEARIRAVENDLQRLRETGNSQYAYYAQLKLINLVELLPNNWKPETDAG